MTNFSHTHDKDCDDDCGEKIIGNDGDNTLVGTDCDDTISGGRGDDTITAKDGNDWIDGGKGNDVIDGGAGKDTIYGGRGDDLITAGAGRDVVYGQDGCDTITGGGENDYLSGGDDADTFKIVPGGSSAINYTTVDGGNGGYDDDTLNYGGLLKDGYELVSHKSVYDFDFFGKPGYNGTLKFYNSETCQWQIITYCDIENVVPCFTPGSLIATPDGEIPVEMLRPGHKVMTRDNGVQEIAWAGRADLGYSDLVARPEQAPVLIKAGALGNGLPERDMRVSPNHRMLLTGDRAQLYFAEYEVLASAKHLVGRPGIVSAAVPGVSYVHFMFENHEVVLADGAWSESFQPGEITMNSMGRTQRDEIYALFPQLRAKTGREEYRSARKTLKRHEAALLR
ncbi:hypothetical protein BFP70_12630 [Thioclava sp. SK-1]|uniref:Hint domain-containing protein n=1 Tax=Thioclava sp. SK-1 TaxID=1889770 RepID=UPI00082401A8|nr:Hint domain-containing protein [Thioclava sp. SK-1]OCX63057.1 hypothetical protein BFP70_12630 [Thioclava sp. SK-1]